MRCEVARRLAINAPAINKDVRLTDAINKGSGELEISDASGDPVEGVRGDGKAEGVSCAPVEVSARTDNRRSREAYNAYMRRYMKTYRANGKAK